MYFVLDGVLSMRHDQEMPEKMLREKKERRKFGWESLAENIKVVYYNPYVHDN